MMMKKMIVALCTMFMVATTVSAASTELNVVTEDDFSPEDFDKDHSEYSFENASRY